MAQIDVYRKCIDAARNDSDGLFRGVTRLVLETFQAHAESALSSRDRKRYAEYLAVLRRVEGDLVHACVKGFDALLQPSMLGQQAGQGDATGLSLGDDDTLWEDVEVSQLMLMIESGTELELRELDARMESLSPPESGLDNGTVPANPLRPEIFARTLQQALKGLDLSLETREALLGAFGVAMADALKLMYSAYNERLESAKNSQVGTPPAPATADTTSGVDTAQPVQQDTAPEPQQGLATPESLPAPAAGVEPAPDGAAQTTSLRAVLDRLTQASRQHAAEALTRSGEPGAAHATPVNVIQAHRQDLQDASSGLLDRLIIDAVALMFDHTLADPRLLPQARMALGLLQVPVLRLALLDAGVLSSPEHAARRFMNRIASLSAHYSAADEAGADGFLEWLNAQVAVIVHARRESEDLYVQALERLHEWVANGSATSAAASGSAPGSPERGALRDAVGRETLSQLQQLDVDPYLVDFMRGPWTSVLVESTLCDGESAPTTQAYRQCGHDLLESVQAKTSDAERKALLEQLPDIVRRLQDGLTLIAWPQAESAAFFSNLMRTHAQAMRGASGAASFQPSDGLLAPGAGDAPPAMGLVSAPEVVSAPEDAPAPAGKPEESGGSEALRAAEDALRSGASPPLGAAREAAGSPQVRSMDDPQAFIDGLQEGHWVLWNLQGQWTSARLTWRSPQGLLFMFTSRVGGQAHSLTRRAFERLLKSEQILPMQHQAPLEGRAQGLGKTPRRDTSRLT